MRAHGGKPVQPAAARQPQQKGFGLIVLGMADKQGGNLMFRQPCAHQPVARFARRGFDAALRLGAAPGQDMGFQSGLFGPDRYFFGIPGSGFSQAMIHAQHDRCGKLLRLREGAQQMHQRQGVAAARYRNHEWTGMTGHRRSEFLAELTCCKPFCGGSRLGRGSAARHWGISI